MSRIPLSVVVLTKNEESNIEDCLKSVYGWANEIIVIDNESTDKTVQLAQKYADKTLLKTMFNEGAHRNWAYAQASNYWVLSLDADERVTPQLQLEISKTILQTKLFAFSIPRKNYIGDYWVKHGGQYPAGQVRLFLRKHFRFEETLVHPCAFVDGGQEKVGALKSDLIHYTYRDLEHYLFKLNQQSTLEAKKWLVSSRRMTLSRALFRACDRFIRSFIFKMGFRDGLTGFMFSYYAALYQIVSYSKYWEMKRKT